MPVKPASASHFSTELNLDFWPANLFSSITPANIDRDIRPEIILGAYNGLVFLNHDGEPKYSQAHTGRYYFSTPVVLDMEGDYSNIDMDGEKISYYKDFEMLTGSDDTNRDAFLEAWHATGGDVFDYTAAHSGESAFVLGITVGELSGTMEDDKYDEADKEKAWMEIVFATHDKGMRIYEKQGQQFGVRQGVGSPPNQAFPRSLRDGPAADRKVGHRGPPGRGSGNPLPAPALLT